MISDIDIDVPVSTAYNQWTQFADFPLFMDHLVEVEQLDETHVRFKATILGIKREWEAEITEQTPDQRIAWQSTDGAQNSGVVTFHPLDDTTTRVVLQLEMDPSGVLEHIADKGGFVKDRATIDLKAFKDFIEQRGHETGAYRESVTRDADHELKRRKEHYESMNKGELDALAQDRDLEGRSGLTKAELVDALARDDRT